MDRHPTATFKGYDIFTFAIPLGRDRWAGTGEIQRINEQGKLDIDQQISGPCIASTEADARARACHAAEQRILEMASDPVPDYH